VARVAVLALMVAAALLAFAGAEEDYGFYVFADSRCPHCRSLIEFFREQGYRYSACYVDLSAACRALFSDFLEAAGLPGLVPVTVAVVDGDVAAIVVGALRDAQFWEMVKSAGGAGDGIPVYVPAGAGIAKAGSVPASREGALFSILSRFPGEEGVVGAERAGGLGVDVKALVGLAAVLAFIVLLGAVAYRAAKLKGLRV